jgi:predicted transcriptional regulator
MPKMANQYRPWLAKCPVKTKWGSLIPRPLKMDEGLSTSKRQAEGKNRPIKYENLPMSLFNLTITIVESVSLKENSKKCYQDITL